MNITLITFSPTGGTLKCAKILTEAIGPAYRSIDLTQRELETHSLTSEDVALIAVPSFGGRVPPLAIDRMRHSVRGNDTKAILLAVYGNRAYEDTLVEMHDIVKELGFKVVAAVSAVSRHSIATEIASDRPDERDREQLESFGLKIRQKLGSPVVDLVGIPGNRPYKKSSAGIVPKTSANKCNNCGRCAKECPSGAIDGSDPRNIDSKMCATCMRCVAICPSEAKHVPRTMLWIVAKMLKKPCSLRKEVELFI